MALVCHKGPSPQHGHFITYSYVQRFRQWFRFDDKRGGNHVSQIGNMQDVKRQYESEDFIVTALGYVNLNDDFE